MRPGGCPWQQKQLPRAARPRSFAATEFPSLRPPERPSWLTSGSLFSHRKRAEASAVCQAAAASSHQRLSSSESACPCGLSGLHSPPASKQASMSSELLAERDPSYPLPAPSLLSRRPEQVPRSPTATTGGGVQKSGNHSNKLLRLKINRQQHQSQHAAADPAPSLGGGGMSTSSSSSGTHQLPPQQLSLLYSAQVRVLVGWWLG